MYLKSTRLIFFLCLLGIVLFSCQLKTASREESSIATDTVSYPVITTENLSQADTGISKKNDRSEKLKGINTFIIDELAINGLPTSEMTRKNLIRVLGKPRKITYPEYECGFLSNSEQSARFESFHYRGILFTGSVPEAYTIEEIRFDKLPDWSITYRNRRISSATTLQEFAEIFEMNIMPDNSKDEQRIDISCLLPEGYEQLISDDLYFFTFRDGHLVLMEYWSPC